MSEAAWRAFDDALTAAACPDGRPIRFWLRDDDAVAVTPAIERLATLTAERDLPVLLAVIPAGFTPGLADWLSQWPTIVPCQHGLAHANHAAPGARACELGGERDDAAVLDDLRDGRARLLRQLGAAALSPVLVPPWNRIRDSLLPHLPALGYAALSTFSGSGALPPSPLPRLDCDLDIINWRAGGRGRDADDLCARLVTLVAAAARTGRPIGILTHHLAHDATAWAFLDRFVATLRGDPRVAFTSAAQELGGPVRPSEGRGAP